MFVVSNKRS